MSGLLRTCGKCRTANAPGAETCAYCEGPLSEPEPRPGRPPEPVPPVETRAPEPPPEPAPEPKPEPPKKPEIPRKACPNCGFENPVQVQICGLCLSPFPDALDKIERVPFARQNTQEPPAAGGQPAAAAPPPAQPAAPKAKSIVIIEDDDSFAQMVMSFLRSLKMRNIYRIDRLSEAVAIAEQLNVGLVVLDLILPGYGNGVQIYEQLRAHPKLEKELPVVFLTALAPEKAKEVVPQGDRFTRLLHKPLDFEQLTFAVRDLAEEKFRDAL